MFNTELMELYPRMGYFALRLTKNPDNAKDIVHDTIIRAIERQDQFDTATNLWRWVSRIMYTVFIDTCRTDKKNLLLHAQVKRTGAEQADQLETTYLRQIIDKINKLGDTQRNILLYVAADYSHADIADELGIPDGTVRSRLSRARQELELSM